MNISNAITTVITISLFLVSILTILSIFASLQSSSFMIEAYSQSEYEMIMDNIVNKYENNKNNSNNEQNALKPTQPVDNNVYVVWEDVQRTDDNHRDNEIFLSISNDTGQNFGTQINLSNNTRDSHIPQILSEKNMVFVVWVDSSPGGNNIFFTASNDTGQTFSTQKKLSNNIGYSYNPQLSTAGNNVYVVWQGYTDNIVDDIFFTASNDNGQNFSSPINLSNDTAISSNPQLSTAGNNVYVVWQDYTYNTTHYTFNIFFTPSNDTGETFTTPKKLSNNIGYSSDPQISIKGNNVYVVWQNVAYNNPNSFPAYIYFTASNDNGQNFSPPKKLNNHVSILSSPQILTVENNVYVVWDQDIADSAEIFFTASNDNGQNFSIPINISNDSELSGAPQISSEGNKLYVIWSEEILDDTYNIFFTASNDTGQTFSTPKKLSNNIGYSYNPQLSTAGNNVYVVWQNKVESSSSIPEIFFTASNDTGETFSTPINLSNNTEYSIYPQVSSSSS